MNRRRFIQAGTSIPAVTAISALWGCSHSVTPKAPFLLIPPPFSGGWIWDRVTPLLSAAGHRIYAPTPIGVGNRAAEFSPSIDLDTHVDEFISMLERNDLRNVILVGSSLYGIVLVMIADRSPGRLRRLVFVDAIIPENNKSVRSAMSPAQQAVFTKRIAYRNGEEVGLNPLPSSAVGIFDKEDHHWFHRQLTIHPIGVYNQVVRLHNPIGNGVEKVFIDCTNPPQVAINASRAIAKSQSGWKVEQLSTGHLPMVTAPNELATTLLRNAT